MKLFSSSSLRYISNQLEKMKSKLKKIEVDRLVLQVRRLHGIVLNHLISN